VQWERVGDSASYPSEMWNPSTCPPHPEGNGLPATTGSSPGRGLFTLAAAAVPL